MDRTEHGQGWVPDLESFGARLALIRQRKGWNIAEAERMCGVGRGSWALWEQGGREPSRYITICVQIAGATGVDLDWLVYGPSRPTKEGVTLREPAYPRIDPLAARPITHSDKRRRSSGRLTPVRFAGTTQSVSLAARA